MVDNTGKTELFKEIDERIHLKVKELASNEDNADKIESLVKEEVKSLAEEVSVYKEDLKVTKDLLLEMSKSNNSFGGEGVEKISEEYFSKAKEYSSSDRRNKIRSKELDDLRGLEKKAKEYNISNPNSVGLFLTHGYDNALTNYRRRRSVLLEDIGTRLVEENSYSMYYDEEDYPDYSTSKEAPTPSVMDNLWREKRFNLGSHSLTSFLTKETMVYALNVSMDLTSYIQSRMNNAAVQFLAKSLTALDDNQQNVYFKSIFNRDVSYVDMDSLTFPFNGFETPADLYIPDTVFWYGYDSSITAPSDPMGIQLRLVDLMDSLHPDFEPTSYFYMNSQTFNHIKKLVDADGRLMQYFSTFNRMRDDGKLENVVKIDSYMKTGVIAYGDMSQFYMRFINTKLSESFIDAENIERPGRIGIWQQLYTGGDIFHTQSVRFLFATDLISPPVRKVITRSVNKDHYLAKELKENQESKKKK